MSENILHFYKLKTEREQNEVNQPYRKIMDSKMERANQFSNKIILNKVYIVSIWEKIIKNFVENKDKEVLIKNLKDYINMYSTDDVNDIIYKKIDIQDLIDRVEDKKVVKSYMNLIDTLIKKEIILTEEYQRSNIREETYRKNSLVLEELKDLKKIFTLEDFKSIFSFDFEVDSYSLNRIIYNYTNKNNQEVFENNIKSLYDSL